MTVEIRELVIKTTVTDKTSTGGTEGPTSEKAVAQGLVERCVAEVLQILKREKER
jgi:hypothetical protein